MKTFVRANSLLSASLLGVIVVGTCGGAAAQEVVQRLPSPASQQLSSALQRLARNDGDVDAMLDAGEAALELNDIPAAIGFFGRAKDMSPGNSRVSLGLARAYTLSRRPVEALRYFAEAERAGVAPVRMAADRAKAFDLVGDAATAQQLYRIALGSSDNGEVRRNLALSLAISGNRQQFEDTLRPLLDTGDLAAFRTRAFGLAILGDSEEAVGIAQQMMSPQIANRVAPYLRYMERLTPAQQAAAGILGIFPQSAAIGQDDAQIAAYSPQQPTRIQGAAGAAETTQLSRPVTSSTPAVAQQADAAAGISPTSPLVSRSARPTDPRIPAGEPVPSGQGQHVVVVSKTDAAAEPMARRAPAPVAPPPLSAPAPSISSTVSELPPLAAGAPKTSASEPPMPVRTIPSSSAVSSKPSASNVSLPTRLVLPEEPPSAGAPSQTLPVRSVADAFATFDLSQTSGSSVSAQQGAVDITKIEVPRERNEPVSPPPTLAHPARHWVQVATGKDISALAFDWRRIARKADKLLDGKGPFTTPWVEANRLLAGPYDTASAARLVVNQLKENGIDSFTFTSDAGQEIAPLD